MATKKRGQSHFEGNDSDPFFFEMSITRAEFLRLLPVAVGHAVWQVDGNVIAGEGARPSWRIRLAEMPGRSLGSVRLPVLGVTLEVGGSSEAERAAFLRRFHLGFQRAGG